MVMWIEGEGPVGVRGLKCSQNCIVSQYSTPAHVLFLKYPSIAINIAIRSEEAKLVDVFAKFCYYSARQTSFQHVQTAKALLIIGSWSKKKQ